VGVVGIAGQAHPPQRRGAAGGKDRDAVETLLAVPDAVIAGCPDLHDRKRVVGTFDLLQAKHVGLLLVEIFEKTRQPGANAVEIVGDDLHAGGLAEDGKIVIPDLIRNPAGPGRRQNLFRC
jgi:hypothetical protein